MRIGKRFTREPLNDESPASCVALYLSPYHQSGAARKGADESDRCNDIAR